MKTDNQTRGCFGHVLMAAAHEHLRLPRMDMQIPSFTDGTARPSLKKDGAPCTA
jgi:hypothetical protein